jgi:hypothetical protein
LVVKKGVDFHALARPAQDRFVDAVKGSDVPRPILSVPGGPKTSWMWLALSLVAGSVLFVLPRLGFGDLSSPMSVQGVPTVAAYAVLAALVLLGIAQAATQWARTAALPFTAGVYAFPSCVIDARRHLLQVHPIAELTSVEGPDASNGFTLVFPDARYVFQARTRAEAEEAARALTSAREMGPESVRRVESDPLQEPKFISPLAPQEPITLYSPFWISGRFVLAVALGAAVGFGIWRLRNVASDDRMFARANELHDVDGYRAYLAHGKRHGAEVSSVLLPRAELRIAESAGSVEAIERYIQAHPGSAIQKEVEAALHQAMLDELERAKKPGTLASIAGFVKNHPDHHLDAEIEAAKHAVYRAALARYQGGAGTDKEAIAFVGRLIAWAEAKGPSVQVQFRRKPSTTLVRADKAVEKNPSFNGEVSYPTRYFDAVHAAPGEAALAKTLLDRLGAAFPAEILTFASGPLIEDTSDALPAVTVPTLVVAHSVDWQGVAYVSRTPHGIFVGITFVFELALVIPNDPKPLRFKHTVVRPVPLDVLSDLSKGAPAGSSVEEKAYQSMSQEAFAEVGARFLDVLFAK